MPGATWTKIATTDLGSNSATISFTSISNTYTDLMLVGSLRSNRTSGDATEVTVTLNSQNSGYSYKGIYGNGTSANTFNNTSQVRSFASYTNQNVTGQTDTFGGFQMCIPNKTFSGQPFFLSSGFSEIAATNGYQVFEGATNTAISSAITTITLTAYSGATAFDYVTNSTVTLYGLTRA